MRDPNDFLILLLDGLVNMYGASYSVKRDTAHCSVLQCTTV